MATGNHELVSEQSLMTTRHNSHSGDKSSGNDEEYTIISCIDVKGGHKRNEAKAQHRLYRYTDSDIAKNSQQNE